jgi:hypothetical protein
MIEFRGVRNLTIDLKGKNFAICGKNGTGKSGVVDALEFGLTGNISRLSGKGTGGISLKDHAPHVDSRNRPDKAQIIIQASIPSLKKDVIIERNVKDPSNPTITPNDPDILKVLKQVAVHPEFALSRRELIRYVISTPGDRAKEVQALLQLQEVESVRTVLQKITNSYQKEIIPLKREKEQAHTQLMQALGIPSFTQQSVLDAVNLRRKLLGLNVIEGLTSATSLKDGLVTAAAPGQPLRVSKIQATSDLKKLKELTERIASPEITEPLFALIEKLTELSADSALIGNVTKDKFLKTAIALIENDACPVCDTTWNPIELKEHIAEKLKHFEAVAKKRAAFESELAPYIAILLELGYVLKSIETYGSLFNPAVNVAALEKYRSSIGVKYKGIQEFLPLPATISHLQSFTEVPEDVVAAILALNLAVGAIPEPSEQDAARDYLILGQERFGHYKAISLRHKQAEDRASVSNKIFEAYAKSSTAVLNNIYKEVEQDFSEFYRIINHDDEGHFTAQLTPSIGKLGFDVDFYGRGFFPPGAYHSEGHQDGMGLCLYLALMKHLQGDSFTFAVLDDVLMSVDSGHRREVCSLLKSKFPDTQFILTTHDDIWLRHMRTVGLILRGAAMHFRKWNIDQGPTEWSDRDVWDEIGDYLGKDDVRAAAGLLRHYLEYVSAEICHYLRAPVEFRGDHQFELGDLLPAAIGRFNSLLKEAKAAANSWNNKDALTAITAMETNFSHYVAVSNIEQWQINPAVHYNEWANFQTADFTPVVKAYRELIESLNCNACNSILYLVSNQGSREALRCSCGAININLRKK